MTNIKQKERKNERKSENKAQQNLREMRDINGR